MWGLLKVWVWTFPGAQRPPTYSGSQEEVSPGCGGYRLLKWDGVEKREGGSRKLYVGKRHLFLGLRFFLDASLVPRSADLESPPLCLTNNSEGHGESLRVLEQRRSLIKWMSPWPILRGARLQPPPFLTLSTGLQEEEIALILC